MNWFDEEDPINHLVEFDNNKRPRSLYFGNNLLLEDVRDFHLYLNKNTIKIDINFKNKIIQSWEFEI